MSSGKGFLFDLRVLEIADERGEFLGKLLAGAGADVVKVEPPGGSRTRAIGPFYQDKPHPERSLFFWHYNFGKRGVTLDIKKAPGRDLLTRLIPSFDIIIHTGAPGELDDLGLGYKALSAINPRIIVAAITPFGQTGPWRDLKASDIVHLALGGVMMNCGYDPMPSMEYDVPPIAPQMWHAYHITCNNTYMATLGALLYREQTGRGQFLDASIHQAVSTCTEVDIPHMVYARQPVWRQTGRHAMTTIVAGSQSVTKDGRYVNASGVLGGTQQPLFEMLNKYGAADDLMDEKYKDPAVQKDPVVSRHINAVMKRFIQSYTFDRDLWKEGQKYNMHWSPIRKPHENLTDPHWAARKTFTQVYHEDLGKTFAYNGAPWLAGKAQWRTGPRAPHLGEHNGDVYGKELGMSASEIAKLKKQIII